MSNWNTLNNGLTASVKDAVELQASISFAITMNHKGQLQSARRMYEELVAHHLVQREPKPKKKSAAASSTNAYNASSNNAANSDADHVEESPLSTLRFLVFKNYASILKDEYMTEQNQHNHAIADKALYNYLQAVKIDPTDYSLWYHIGYLSQKLHKLRFARLAYETGFYMSDQERTLKLPTVRPNDAHRIVNGGKFTVMQWRCLENLCQVLYDIGDYRLCTFYVDLALKRNAHWETGLQLKQQLSDAHKLPSVEMDDWRTEAMETDRMYNNPITIHLEKSDWTLLIKSLLDEHKRLVYKDASNNSSQKAAGVNDIEAEQPKVEFFVSHAIMIHVDDTEEKDEEKEKTQQSSDDSAQQASEAVVTIPEPVVMLEKPVDQERLPKEPTNDESDSTRAMDIDTIREPVVLVERLDALLAVGETTANDSGEPVDQNVTIEQSAVIAALASSDQARADPLEEPSRPKPIAISDLLSQSSSVPMPLLALVPSPTATESTVIESTPDISSDVEMIDATLVPLKRKREDHGDDEPASQTDIIHEKSSNVDEHHDNDGEDEEEEEEAEEKRLSLRASKRQREKIANEETSRLKMLEEEESFTGKVRNFYETLNCVPQLKPQVPWLNSSTESFWEWFDKKISELDSTYCWDIDTVNNAIKGEIQNRALIKQFILDLNTNNSGIVDSLCKLVTTIVSHNLHLAQQQQEIMSTEMLELVTDTICQVQPNLVQDIASNAALNSQERVFIYLRISEYLIDRLIRNTITTLEEMPLTTPSTHKKRMSTSLAKQAKLKSLDSLIEQAGFWSSLVEQSVYATSMDLFSTRTDTATDDINHIQLRYCVLKGKLAQCSNDIESAYAWYDKCRQLLAEKATVEIDTGSMYDSFINKVSIDKKLELLQVGKLFVTAKQKMANNDYNGVIEDLQGIVEPQLSSSKENPVDSDENIQMTSMLAKAYFENHRRLDAWNCYMRMLCCAMRQLISYGEAQVVVAASSRPNKNEDVEFTSTLARISCILDALIKLVEQENKSKGQDTHQDWMPRAINQELLDTLSVLLKMSIYYIYRHPDFVPVVNNFNDLPPHTPSKTSRVNGFNDILAKSWVLHSHLMLHIIETNKESVPENAMVIWAEVLTDLHYQLGEREICSSGKSILLQHMRTVFRQLDGPVFRLEFYQCYVCLYGVEHIPISGVEEHHSVHSHLDQKAAEPLFTLIADEAIEKLQGGLLLKNDLKGVVETVSHLFEELDTKKHVQVRNNKKIIEDYLDSQIQLHSSFDTMIRAAIIPTVDIDPKKTGISPVFFKIFYIRGKTIRLQVRNRSKSSNDRSMADLEEAVEELTSHVILNPSDADGWYELGFTYQLLATEELNWSASNILDHKDQITEYQKKSFHAFARGLYLRDFPLTDAAKNELFFGFGCLVYSIASPPMNMEAFKVARSKKKILGPDGKLVNMQTKTPSSTTAYKLAMRLFGHAIKYKTVDKYEWSSYYMVGKCCDKIDRPPMEVLDWYLQAIRRTKLKNGRHEHVLEPIYNFCSALVKFLHQGKIDATTVLEFLNKEQLLQQASSLKQQREEKDSDVVHMGSSVDNMVVVQTQEQQPRPAPSSSATDRVLNELTIFSEHLPNNTANAYNSIFKRLVEIRAADSKGLHHRVIYRMAWMYYHVYHQTDEAKSSLLQLFSLKGNSKHHANIWKHGFELPAKHYVFVKKYTLFLIELARESNDAQTLKNLYRKLKKAKQVLMNEKQVFRSAYRAYLEIIKAHLVSLHRADSILERIRNSRLDKLNFEAICSTCVRSLSEDKSLTDPELYALLQDLAELRRLTQGFISVTDSDSDGLDDAIQMCFAVVAFGGEHTQERLPEGSNEDENNGKTLLETLSTQAKILMQNTTTTSKVA
ncbi:hypothetical protein MAM1_0115c05695 [Mucor ambiguus]|uniref:Histone transcription regulator 3 homolog n=1 Tax=Mucor ambiguus TaxID=91626 RepID=A0A0C9LV61_9FUNG|nr:hypothetical protein MAM1_0115c05695 [Mucor ambiguus]